jgi:hypothetical protein
VIRLCLTSQARLSAERCRRQDNSASGRSAPPCGPPPFSKRPPPPAGWRGSLRHRRSRRDPYRSNNWSRRRGMRGLYARRSIARGIRSRDELRRHGRSSAKRGVIERCKIFARHAARVIFDFGGSQSLLGTERCLLASAAIRLASTAKPLALTRPSAMQRPTMDSKSWAKCRSHESGHAGSWKTSNHMGPCRRGRGGRTSDRRD